MLMHLLNHAYYLLTLHDEIILIALDSGVSYAKKAYTRK